MSQEKYYIRKPGGTEFLGTFSVIEIKEQLNSGRINSAWEAVLATGQSYGQLRRTTGWINIGLIAGDEFNDAERTEEPAGASFNCACCATQIRLPLLEATYKCPRCQTKYFVKRISDKPIAFLVVTEIEQSKSQSTKQPRRDCPPEVKKALVLFGVDETVKIEEIRRVYRDLVKSYHPDKVAHLGVDLRRVAEAKTKEINIAIKILENYYAS